MGRGCSSPIAVGGRVFTIGWEGAYRPSGAEPGRDVVRCLDAETGEEVWKQSYPAPLRSRHRISNEEEYGGPLATPAFDPETGYLFTLGIDGDLRCWDARDGGRPVWRVALYDAYRVARRPDVGGGRCDFGCTASPLLLGDLVIVEVGADEGTLMAFNRRTGERVWRSEANVPAGHSGGLAPMALDDGRAVAVFTLNGLLVVRAEGPRAGETVVEIPWRTNYGCNIPTPAVSGEKVLLTTAYNVASSGLFEVRGGTAHSLWRSRAYALLSSPTVHEGRAYMVAGSLKCLDLESGRTRWSGGRFGHGSCLVTGDGRLLVWGENTLALVEGAARSPDRYTELARVENVLSRNGLCYPHVALAGGRILCGNKDGLLACLALRPKQPK